MKYLLRDGPADELFTFYYCHRATLRARLAIAHLLEEHPRTPEKWPRLCATYLDLAETERTRAGGAISEHHQIGQAALFVQTPDCLSEQGGARQNNQLFILRGTVKPERRHRVGNDDLIKGLIGEDFARARHEQSVRNERDHALGAGGAGRTSRAQQGASGADQIVDYQRCSIRHVAGEQIARDNPRAAVFFCETFADRATKSNFQNSPAAILRASCRRHPEK